MKNLLAVTLVLLLSVMAQAAGPSGSLGATVNLLAPAGSPSPSVALSCTAPTTGVTPNGYNFYRSTSSTMASPSKLTTTASSTCTFTDSTVSYGTTYYYAATSVNTATCPAGSTCESGYSNIAQAAVGANPIPNAPTGLTVGSITLAKVTLSWQEQGTYTAFRLFRKRTTATKWPGAIKTGIKTTSYTDMNVPYGTWNYAVKAVNNVKGVVYLSAFSNVVTANVQ